MKKKKTPLSIPVLWFATTVVILVRLCYAAHNDASADQRFLLWLFMAVSLIAAVVNLKRYKRDKINEEENSL